MFLVNFKSQMRLLTQNPCLAVKFIIVRHMQVLGLGTGTPRFSSIIFLPLRALCLKDSIYDGHHSQSMHSTKCAIAPMTSVKKRDVPVQRCTLHTAHCARVHNAHCAKAQSRLPIIAPELRNLPQCEGQVLLSSFELR